MTTAAAVSTGKDSFSGRAVGPFSNGLSFVLIVTAFALLGCGNGSPTAGSAGPGSQTLIYGCGNDATTLDPADAEDGESSKVINNIFDTLVTVTPDGLEIQPSLATSWSVSDNDLRWKFVLRSGVTFQDGTPFDAESVVFSFRRLMDEKSPNRFGAKLPYRGSFAMIDKVEATGPLEVTFTLKEPSGVLLRNLAMFSASIVSPTAVQKEKEKFKVRPVGTGPFAFEFWDPDQKIVLRRNEAYWGEAPPLETVIFKPIAEPAARLRQLQNGEIDMADNLSIPVLLEARRSPGITVQSIPGYNTAYLAMNNDREPLNRLEVRKAIAHAIDKKAIVASAFEGEAVPATTLVPNTMWGFDPEIKDYAYDPDEARRLLAAAGVKPGTKIPMWVMTNSRPYMPAPDRVAAIIQQQLRAVGLEPQLQSPPWTQYLEQVGNGEAPLALFGWQSDNADPDNFLFELLDPSNANPPHAHNVSFYRSPKVHELLIAAQRTADPSERETLYFKAQKQIHADCPMVPLVHVDQSIALRDTVQGYQLNPAGKVWLRPVYLGSPKPHNPPLEPKP